MGAPVAVSLVQGNVTQELKFDPEFRRTTFELYTGLVAREPRPPGRAPGERVPGVRRRSAGKRAASNCWMPWRHATATCSPACSPSRPRSPPADGPRYYNSVVSIGAARPQLYRKRHLVPFGETIPLEPVVGWFIRRILSIPIASQASGDPDPPVLEVAGQRVAVNICYEDAFGAEIRVQAEDATILVNVTNDAWYARSLAALQHNQIAAMRALETGRPLLRATNTGITSAIGARWARARAAAVVHARHPRSRDHGRQGVTPYVRFGDALPVAGCA